MVRICFAFAYCAPSHVVSSNDSHSHGDMRYALSGVYVIKNPRRILYRICNLLLHGFINEFYAHSSGSSNRDRHEDGSHTRNQMLRNLDDGRLFQR